MGCGVREKGGRWRGGQRVVSERVGRVGWWWFNAAERNVIGTRCLGDERRMTDRLDMGGSWCSDAAGCFLKLMGG